MEATPQEDEFIGFINERYALIDKLGQGGQASVYRAIDQQTGQKVAVKVFRKQSKQVQNEIRALESLDHPNIARIFDYGKTNHINKKGKEKTIPFLTTEILTKGDLYDMVEQTGGFTEPMARALMRQVLEAVDYIHMNGFAHRDLKLDNIMLDDNFQPKVIDFGFSAPIISDTKEGKTDLLQTICGTPGYMAPEILSGQNYMGDQIDIFALGVMLFTLVASRPPFLSASKNDEIYKLLMTERTQLFWKLHTKSQPNMFSMDLKELIAGMLHPTGDNRPTAEEVLSHSWFQGPTYSPEELIEELMKRYQTMNKPD